MADAYLRSLASDYLALIAMMRSGAYHGYELYTLSAQRSGVHDELIRVLGDAYARPFDMQSWCRQVLSET